VRPAPSPTHDAVEGAAASAEAAAAAVPTPPPEHYDTIVADSLFQVVAAGQMEIPLASMGDYLRSRGDVPEPTISTMVHELDINGDGVIDLSEWRHGWATLIAPQLQASA